METFLKRVSAAQNELKAPKNQLNKFGGYKYRSCEDILEAAKPVCLKYGLVLTLSDDVLFVAERYYIKATAMLRDSESDAYISNTALARESLDKKGMDDSQITGTASSYARKYALNGLFCIDDTKDADTDEYAEQTKTKRPAAPKQEAPKKDNGSWGEIARPIFKCADCGAAITEVTTKNGKHYAVDELVKMSSNYYGRNLCYACACKAAKAKENGSKE